MAIVTVHVNQAGESTAEGVVRHHVVLMDRPESKGGADEGAMGGEMLLLSLGGCFMSNLLAAIRTRSAPIRDVQLSIDGTLANNPNRFEAIEMRVSATHADADLLQKLVTISERSCIVANTLKNSVALSIIVEDGEESEA